jgi:hypothetical protein
MFLLASGKNDTGLTLFVTLAALSLACAPTPFKPFHGTSAGDGSAMVTPPSPDAGTTVPPSSDSSVPTGSPDRPSMMSTPDARGPSTTPDAGVPSGSPDAPPMPPPTNPGVACGMAQPWMADGTYKDGSQVTHGTPPHVYQCLPFPNSGWCPMSAYEPGKDGAPWMDAWKDVGPCP